MKKLLIALVIIVAIVPGMATTLINNLGDSANAASLKSAVNTVISPIKEVVAADGSVTCYFTNDKPDKALINVIDKSQKSLDIAIYTLTKDEIVKAIKNAKNRGVSVRLIVDGDQAGNKYMQKQLLVLKEAGVPIKVDCHEGLMHLKVTVVDSDTVCIGSYNYTEAGSSKNDEVLVVIDDNKNITGEFAEEFQKMWDDTVNFNPHSAPFFIKLVFFIPAVLQSCSQ